MKMNYLPTHKRERKPRTHIGIPILFCAALVLFYYLYPAPLASFAARVAVPFFKVRTLVGDTFHTGLAYVTSKRTLFRENERLRGELARVQAALLDRALLEDELALLKRDFGRSDASGERIIGTVLSRPPKSPYDTFIVDAGEREGITVGSEVAYGEVLLGTVSKVHRTTAVIELYSTAGRKTPVLITHAGASIPAEAIGRGGGEFMAILPKEIELYEGDLVTLPGKTPRVFARVEAVEGKDTDSFQYVRFKNPVSLFAVRFLEIRKQSVEPL